MVSSNDTESKVRAVKDSAKPSTKPSKSTQEEKADQTKNLRDFLGMVIRKELKSILFKKKAAPPLGPGRPGPRGDGSPHQPVEKTGLDTSMVLNIRGLLLARDLDQGDRVRVRNKVDYLSDMFCHRNVLYSIITET